MEQNDKIDMPDEVKQALRRDAEKKSATQTTQESAKPTQQQTPVFTQQSDQAKKFEYPSEVVDLPSQGWFYDPSSPLASGKIDIKYMTAKEEDILTSQNLIKKGVVLDKLLEALIVTPNVQLNDILVGDKNAIFVAARILAYGKDYKIKFKDPSNNEDVEDAIDLAQLNQKSLTLKSTNVEAIFFHLNFHLVKRMFTGVFLHTKTSKTLMRNLKVLKSLQKIKTKLLKLQLV